MKRAFTFYEIVVVVVVIGILSAVAISRMQLDRKQEAADQILSHIKYTQHLALMNDVFEPYPIDSSVKETQRCKYYYKQRWQIYFTDSDGTIYYQIFSDLPDNSNTACFNKNTESDPHEIAIDPGSGKLLIGNWKELGGNTHYPSKEEVNTKLNLTLEYGIKKIIIEPTSYSSSNMGNNLGDRVRILFDYIGRPYFDEGREGVDRGTVNPFDNEKKPLRDIVKIHFCFDSGCSEKFIIAIEPETGYAYLT